MASEHGVEWASGGLVLEDILMRFTKYRGGSMNNYYYVILLDRVVCRSKTQCQTPGANVLTSSV